MVESNILLEAGTNELEILEFLVTLHDGKTQSFGINVAKVREVITVPKYDEVPNADPSVLGVFQLRGKVMPLIDLSNYLHGHLESESKAKVIVTEFNNQNFGFLVDDVVSIHRLSWEDVIPPTQSLSNQEHDCVIALVPMEDKTLFMLDFEKIVTDINPDSGLSSKGMDAELADKLEGEYRIIIADDSETIRNMITAILKKAGFTVQAFNNGALAWDYLDKTSSELTSAGKTIKGTIDLVVSDIEMPQMDGHTLCKKIKSTTALQDVPVVLFSSLIYEELRKKGEAVGADAQISKPELQNLVHIVKSCLVKANQTQPIAA